MAKAPAFQFFPRDYLTDEAVVRMTLEQQGAYIRLLSHQWLEGSIPADMPGLAALCKVSETKMQKIWAGVQKKFSPAEEGRLCNPRMEEDRAEQDKWRQQQSIGGRLGAEKRWGKDRSTDGPPNGPPKGKPMGSDSSASASASASAKKHSYDEEFERTWVDYPSRQGDNNKLDAYKQWQVRLKQGHTAAEMHAGVQRYAAYCFATKNTGTQWVKQGKTFFGPSLHFKSPWTLPDPAAGKPSPGSEADAIRDELPRSTTPRQGADPLDAHRRQEQEEDERVATWSAENPEQVELIRAEVATAMAAWSGLREETRERIARGEYRKRVLQRLRPAAVA